MSGSGATAEDLAEQYESGKLDYDKQIHCGGSGKQRTKAEQQDHKHEHKEGETRKIVTNAHQGKEKRKEEELKKSK